MTNGYIIIIQTQLSERMVAQLGESNFFYLPTGDTVLLSTQLDQAGLYGLVCRCRDLGVAIMALIPLSLPVQSALAQQLDANS